MKLIDCIKSEWEQARLDGRTMRLAVPINNGFVAHRVESVVEDGLVLLDDKGQSVYMKWEVVPICFVPSAIQAARAMPLNGKTIVPIGKTERGEP